MRHVTLTGVLLSTLLDATSLNAAPAHNWSYRFGGSGSNTSYDVAMDLSGNVIIAGGFTGSMNFGGGVLASAGGSDVFIAKFDPTGAHQWSQRFGAAALDEASAVTIDAAGNIIVTGTFRGPASLGGGPLTGRGGQDIFVAKFNGAGLHQWSRWFGSTGSDTGEDIAVDALGNLVLTGQYGAAIDFGGGSTPWSGTVDAYVLKLDASGAYQWSKGAGAAGQDIGFGVAVDASHNVFVTGSFANTVNFGGGGITSTGLSDVFVAKYAENGLHLWSKKIGGPFSDVGQGIGVDATGSVVVTGMFRGPFITRYDATGVQQWIQNFTTSEVVQGMDLAVSSAGAIAITGNLRGTLSLGGSPLTSSGDDDVFIAFYDATGAHRWSQRYGNTGDDWGYGCVFEPAGNLIATGAFSMSIDFGGGPLMSAGLNDVYLARFEDEVVVVDTTPPVITCPGAIQVELTTPGGTPATHPTIAAFLTGASAVDETDPAPAVTHNAPAVFPLGTTPVTFHAMDATGNSAECVANVSVTDGSAPQIAVVLDRNVLWPPNHKLVTVCADVTVSDNSGAATYSLVSITSNESVNGRGDGNTKTDIRGAETGTPDRCFELRAERAGNGDGRVYEIVYSASDASGNAAYGTVCVRVPHDRSDLDESAQMGGATALTSVHPNPFNPQTTLEYSLASSDRVRIVIYDARGSVVRELVNELMDAGDHRVMWQGIDNHGHPVSSGIYFVRMAAGGMVETRKIVLLK